jgi:hypothetical protein
VSKTALGVNVRGRRTCPASRRMRSEPPPETGCRRNHGLTSIISQYAHKMRAHGAILDYLRRVRRVLIRRALRLLGRTIVVDCAGT